MTVETYADVVIHTAGDMTDKGELGNGQYETVGTVAVSKRCREEGEERGGRWRKRITGTTKKKGKY